MSMKKSLLFTFVCFGLYGCNGSSDNSKTLAEQLKYDPATQVVENDIHDSVFISALDLSGLDNSKIKNISFTINPKAGSYAKPVTASYDWQYIAANGLYDPSSNRIQLPVFGLYNAYSNDVTINIQFSDSSNYSFQKTIVTDTYVDSAGVYDHVGISIRPTATPTYSYFYMKGSLKNPIIMDIDG